MHGIAGKESERAQRGGMKRAPGVKPGLTPIASASVAVNSKVPVLEPGAETGTETINGGGSNALTGVVSILALATSTSIGCAGLAISAAGAGSITTGTEVRTVTQSQRREA